MMTIVWSTPYPVHLLQPHTQLASKECIDDYSWVVNLARALEGNKQISLHIVTESLLARKTEYTIVNGIHYHVIRSGIPFFHQRILESFLLELMCGFPVRRRRMVQAIKTLKPDLVHAYGTNGVYALAALQSCMPCLISMQTVMHSIYEAEPSPRNRLRAQLEQHVLKKGRYYGCRTLFDSAYVRENNPNASIFTINEVVHSCFFENTWEGNSSHEVLFVGEMCKRKGIEDLLDALLIVIKKVPDCIAHIVGSGAPGYVDALKKSVMDLGLHEQVIFEGPLTREEIAALHRSCRLFVLPSECDNSPNALAEAMVSGMPVIATGVGGIPSMVDHRGTGWLVAKNDVPGLAEAMIHLMRDDRECNRLGRIARSVARQRHAPESVIGEMFTAYHAMLNADG